jgi:hypothetical protein
MTSSFVAKENVQQFNYNTFKENKENNNLESNILGLLNKHRNQNKKGNTQNTLQTSKENLEKLNDKHQNLITNILAEEERYITNHKTHIDEMVEIIQSVR